MSSFLVVRNHQRSCLIELRQMRRLCRDLLARLFPQQIYDVGVHFVSQPEIIRLNETFLKHRGSTDVITFDYPEGSDSDVLRAEVLICVHEAMAQARRFRTSWQSELVRYLVHGLLHLAGYNDLRRPDRQKMKRAEDRLLKHIAARFSLAQLGGSTRTERRRRKGRASSISA